MTENENYLKEARAKIKEFEGGAEPERLREASMSLENVILAQEHDSQIRNQRRKDCLLLWLETIQLLDKFIDPKFNPEDAPDELVQPPPLPNGVVLRPGADPAKIADPQLRAEYEKAIAENRAKIDDYRMQTQLRRLDERIPPKAEDFIRNFYTSAAADQEELKTAIDGIIKKPQRKEQLSKLLKPPQS